jgi:hypothetical protein
LAAWAIVTVRAQEANKTTAQIKRTIRFSRGYMFCAAVKVTTVVVKWKYSPPFYYVGKLRSGFAVCSCFGAAILIGMGFLKSLY